MKFKDIAEFALGHIEPDAQTLKMASLLLIDTLGVAAGAANMHAGVIARNHAARFMTSTQKRDSAHMLFDGREVSITGAAFAMATQIDNLDAHDGYNPTKGHIGCAVVPALCALGEQIPDLSGRDALIALIVRSPEQDVTEPLETEDGAPVGKPFAREHPVIPWVAGLAVALGLHFGVGIYAVVAVAIGLIAGVGVNLFFRAMAARKMSRLEFQLADGIDLMVSSLRAGGGLTDAVESATRTLADPTPSRIDALVRSLANKRLSDGQFDECDLTLGELHKVCESISKTLASIYHGRISYSGDEEKAEERREESVAGKSA